MIYTAVFLPAVFLLFFVFTFLLGGKTLISSDDGYHETYPALVFISGYIRRFIPELLKGRIIMYSPLAGFGEDVFAALSWVGFGDVFLLISAFFSPRRMWIGYALITVLRMWCSGLGFILFARVRRYGLKETVAGALMYSLSGYALGMQMTYMSFQTPTVWFPLTAAGMSKLMEKNGDRRKWFTVTALAVCFQAMCGYYFLYVNILGCLIFFVVEEGSSLAERRLVLRDAGGSFLWTAGSFLTGMGAASVFLFPATVMTLSSVRSGETSAFDRLFYLPSAKNAVRYFTSMFLPRKDCYSLLGMAIPLIVGLSFVYCLARVKKARLYRALIYYILAFLCSFFPLFGVAANGFLYNTIRWHYMLYFLLSALTAYLIPMMARDLASAAGRIRKTGTSSDMTASRGLIFPVEKIITCLCVFAVLNLMLLRAVEYAPASLGGKEVYRSFRKLENIREDLQISAFSRALSEDGREFGEDCFFRYDISDPMSNGGMFFGVPASSEDMSICEPAASRLDPALCLTSSGGGLGSQGFMGLESRDALEALLSVSKYEDYVGEEPLLYDNPQFMPLGIMFRESVAEGDLEELSPVTRMNVMTGKAVISDRFLPEGGPAPDKNRIFMPAEKPGLTEYTEMTREVDYELEGPVRKEGEDLAVSGGSVLTLRFKEEKGPLPFGTEYYAVIENLRGDDQRVIIGDKTIYADAARPGDRMAMVKLFYEPERGSLEISFPFGEKEEVRFSGIKLYRNDNKALRTFAEDRIRDGVVSGYHWEGNGFSENVSTGDGGFLFISLPYSKGWSCTVDGRPAPVLQADYSYMAVPVDPGEHNVSFSYKTPYMGFYALAGFVSLLILISCAISRRVSGGKRPADPGSAGS